MDAEKFANLLRPIRDAALAFEVDVSAELEEYIEQCVRHMDESHLLNFAQAGLLVQGSAMILGRKVEHLHGLVYKVLGNMRNRRENTVEKEDEHNEVTEEEYRSEAGLRVLDTELSLGKSIDLNRMRSSGVNEEKESSSSWSAPELAQWFFEADEAAAPFESFAAASDGGLCIPDLFDLFANSTSQAFNASPTFQNDSIEVSPPLPMEEDDDHALPIPMVDDHDEPYLHDEQLVVEHQERIAPAFEESDPFAELDPYSADSSSTKPLRKGKTWARPRFSLERRPEEYVDIEAALACARLASAAKGGTRLTEIARAARVAIDRRADIRRKDNFKPFSQLVNLLSSHDHGDDNDEAGFAIPPIEDEQDQEAEPIINEGEEPDNNDNFREPSAPAAYEDDDNRMAPPMMMDYDEDENDDLPLSPEGNDRRVSIASSTMSCATISRLARRVAAWQEHLEPILKIREERAPYDAHAAGLDLAADLKQHGRKVPFASVAQDLPRFEVCRRFCAALQLANEGKLRLSHPNQADEIADGSHDFCLALVAGDRQSGDLTTTLSHQHQIVAPSGNSLLESIDETATLENQIPRSTASLKRAAPGPPLRTS